MEENILFKEDEMVDNRQRRESDKRQHKNRKMRSWRYNSKEEEEETEGQQQGGGGGDGRTTAMRRRR